MKLPDSSIPQNDVKCQVKDGPIQSYESVIRHPSVVGGPITESGRAFGQLGHEPINSFAGDGGWEHVTGVGPEDLPGVLGRVI